MGENTKIEWCDHTINLWWGCAKVSDGCKHCYAELLSRRLANNCWGPTSPRREIKNWERELKRLDKKANGIPETVFVGSMMDIFEEDMPTDSGDRTANIRDDFFYEVPFYKNLVFLFLTKRPQNIRKSVPVFWYKVAPNNIWFGTSVCSEKDMGNIDELIQNSPRINRRFLSIEPLIGPIDLRSHLAKTVRVDGTLVPAIDWVIVGGESGYSARPLDLKWVRDVVRDCVQAGIPVFVKQLGTHWAKEHEIKHDKKGGDMKNFPADLQRRMSPVYWFSRPNGEK